MDEIPVFKERRMTGIDVSGMEESYFISNSYAGILRLSPNSSSTLLDLNDAINVTDEIKDYFYYSDDVTSSLENQFVTVSTSDGALLDMSIRNDAVQFNNLYVLGALKTPSIIVYQTKNNTFTINGINMPNTHLADGDFSGNKPEEFSIDDNLDNYYFLIYRGDEQKSFKFVSVKDLFEEFSSNNLNKIASLPTGSIHWAPVNMQEYETLLQKKNNDHGSDSSYISTLASDFLICDGSYYKTEDFPELANVLNSGQISYYDLANEAIELSEETNKNTFRIPDLCSTFIAPTAEGENEPIEYACLPLIKI
jgi:hypothetical protein